MRKSTGPIGVCAAHGQRAGAFRHARRAIKRLLPGAAAMALVMAMFLALLLPACERPAARPDIVLVTIDTLRADHCSSYGYPVATTPNLDAVAAGGIRYAKAYAESATTSPSHAVLMTGRHFRTLAVTRNGDTLGGEAVTLAEALRAAGYDTAAFISSFPLRGSFGFAQGFEHYEDRFKPYETSVARRKAGNKPHDRQADATATRLEKWLKRRKDDRPLFVWVHFVDPHAPYRAPREFVAEWPPGTSQAIQRYDAEVHYADEELGRVLRDLGAHAEKRGREQLVVVTSDHGEGLGDHGWMTHGINIYEEAVRVPLVASWPGRLPQGRVVEEPVGIIDIAPGILALLGIDAKTFSDGLNLFAPADAHRAIALQRREYTSTLEKRRKIGGEMTAMVQGAHKLILAPGELRRELYDLHADPRELKNLLDPRRPAPDGEKAAHEAVARDLENKLAAWSEKYPPAAKPEAPIDEETRRALRSLGYVD